MPKTPSTSGSGPDVSDKKDQAEKTVRQDKKKSSLTTPAALPPRDPVSGRWLSNIESDVSKGKQPLKGGIDRAKSSEKLINDVNLTSTPTLSVYNDVSQVSTGQTHFAQASTAQGGFSEVSVPHFFQMMLDQGLVNPVPASSTGQSGHSTQVCATSPPRGSSPFLSTETCSHSSRSVSQTNRPTPGGGSTSPRGSSRTPRGEALSSGQTGVHYGHLPVGEPSATQMALKFITEIMNKGFPGKNTGGLRDNPSTVSRDQGPRLSNGGSGSTGNPATDTRPRPSLSVQSTGQSPESTLYEGDPTVFTDPSIIGGDGEFPHPPDTAVHSNRAQRLLNHLSQFLPEVTLNTEATTSADRSSSRLGVFRRTTDSFTLGPSQLLNEMWAEITPAAILTGKRRGAGFVSPLPLAECFLPTDQCTSLTLQEQDRLNTPSFPKVTMTKPVHSALEARLATAMKGMSVLSSLFDSTVAQIIKPVGEAEDEYEFVEDSDPNMVGMTLTVMNQSIAGIMRALTATKVDLAIAARNSVLVSQKDLSSEDKKLLLDSPIPQTGLFDPDVLEQRVSAAVKRKSDRLNTSLVESLHKRPRLSSQEKFAGPSQNFQTETPPRFPTPRGRGQSRGRGRGSSSRGRTSSSTAAQSVSAPARGKRF